MKWTIERPTADGIYWMRRPGAKCAEISEVWNGASPVAVDSGCTLRVARLKGSYPPFSEFDWYLTDHRYDGALWYGPITPPSDELRASGELIAVQRDAQRLRNALREVVKDMRARAAWIGPMSALWRDVFEYEMLINGRGDTVFDWDGPDGPKSRNRLPTTPLSEE